ncbi:hypothetical protein JSY14_07225 [Brachybacterium sp. EF45031]|uniref:variant leucine-rich repeat-containing protein n=1 Tax=Brachybacterium sillae TaxID=2810536 RepID=UPI00217CFACF|nr:hypothetical protein [Brachybacterium sillae]MCS6711822.1 hypothetical protein [Brachybacterium sillae]
MDDHDAFAASSADSPLEELRRIAAERPDLHAALARNPATYQDLLRWLATSGDPEVAEAAKARLSGGGSDAASEPDLEDVEPSSPETSARGRRRVPVIPLAAASVLLLAVGAGVGIVAKNALPGEASSQSAPGASQNAAPSAGERGSAPQDPSAAVSDGGDTASTDGTASAGAENGGSSASPAGTSSASAAATDPAPTFEELSNSELEIPASCAEFLELGSGSGETVTFTDGVAPGARSMSSITLEKPQPMTVNGQNATLVQASCYGGGSYQYPVILVYGAGKELLGSISTLDDDYPTPWVTLKPVFDDVVVKGQTITYTHGAIQLFGDDPCAGCGGSGQATMTWTLTEDGMVSEDIVLTAPSKPKVGTIRPVDPDDVNEVISLLADGDRAGAWKYFMPGHFPEELADEPTVDEETQIVIPALSTVFPSDARVDVCQVIGGGDLVARPDGSRGYESYYLGGQQMLLWTLATGMPDPSYDVVPGDTLCRLTSDDSEYSASQVTLILQGTEDGSVRVRSLDLGLLATD